MTDPTPDPTPLPRGNTMALNAYQLEDLIILKLNDAGFQADGNDDQLSVLANAIAEAVVEHITCRAEVHVDDQVCLVR